MNRTWWENEELVGRFRDWLTQTAEEVDALDGRALDDRALDDRALDDRALDDRALDDRALDDRALDDRALDDRAQHGDLPDDVEVEHASAIKDAAAGQEQTDYGSPVHEPELGDDPDSELSTVGLLQLVEAFTAMRHELKLQTKGTRHLEASVEQSLAGLETARRMFDSIQANEREAADRAALPMIEALLDLDEGIHRAVQALRTSHERMTRSAPERLLMDLNQRFEQLPWWRRLMARSWLGETREATCEALSTSIAEEFETLMEGFQLIESRLARTLREHDVRRVDETGGLVDPNRMNVVELVDDAAATPETVVDVVRVGYMWGRRVLRFAEVRAVARHRAPKRDADLLSGDAADSHEQPVRSETSGPHFEGLGQILPIEKIDS